jgi:hypothetical protein
MSNDKTLKADIAKEIYRALDDLCADPQLLSIVGSYGDTLPDADVLGYLKQFNETGTIFSKVIRRAEGPTLVYSHSAAVSGPVRGSKR